MSGGLVQASGSLSPAESAAQAKLHQTRSVYQDLVEYFNDIGYGLGISGMGLCRAQGRFQAELVYA